MRIPFAVDIRDLCARMRSATTLAYATMGTMDDLDERIVAATKKRIRAENAFLNADTELRELLREGRSAGKGPSHMAKLTGFTREWVAKIAPDPKVAARQGAIQRRLDRNAASD